MSKKPEKKTYIISIQGLDGSNFDDLIVRARRETKVFKICLKLCLNRLDGYLGDIEIRTEADGERKEVYSNGYLIGYYYLVHYE